MSRRAASRTSDGAREARERHPRQLGQRGVVEVVGGAHGGVLPGQPGAEEQRVVGAEGHRRAGREQLGERHRGEVGVDAERDVGDRAHLERDAGGDDAVEQLGVLRAAYAVAEPLGAEARRGRCGRGRARAAPRRAAPAAARRARRSRKAPREVRRCARAARRWTARSRPRRGRRTGAPGAPACGRRAGGACGWRRSPPPMPRPVRAEASRDAVEHQVGEGGDAAEAGGVAAGVDLDLQPAPAVADVVLGRLQHQAAYVVRACAAPSAPRRRGAGSGTSPSRRRR